MDTLRHYQVQLGELVLEIKPQIVVETGGGHSTRYILEAMDKNGSGTLYMIDPDPQHKDMLSHPRLRWHKGFSVEFLGAIYEKTGPWDVFLHDSDHDVECQTFEYEAAFGMLRPGGWMISDDIEWGNPIHFAWRDFLLRKGLSCETMGNARITQKSEQVPAVRTEDLAEHLKVCLKMSHDAARDYGSNPLYHLP